jgi:ectoine hydroxylase-related dioxygenase (phytanoyl-CoA dioxygenase family)
MATVLIDDPDIRKQVHEHVSAVFRDRLLSVLHDFRIVVGSYAVKGASTEFSRVGLHQDFSFVKNEGEEVGISIWCPLVDVHAENGWLGVVPGSHLLNSNHREPSSLPYPELCNILEERFMTYLPMQPGQVLFMDNRLFHGSPDNTSSQDRIVAAGIAVPRESQLVYCHRDLGGNADVLEMFEVTDDFYQRHSVGDRPQEGRLVSTIDRVVSELTESDLYSRLPMAVAN